MKRLDWYIVGAILLSLVIIHLTFTPKARAQQGHDLYHDDAYRHWMKPTNPNMSCCNRRILDNDGNRVSGDCYPVEARPVIKDGRFSHWMAKKDSGAWVDIPENIILRRTVNPDHSGVSGHLCESYGTLHCFLPPFGGT